jgi:orotate phosphoribosyltransferase
VVILEDVTTTGASALKAIEAVRSVGAVVVGVISLIDRLEGAAEVFKNQSVIFKPLFTIRVDLSS